MLSSPFTRQLSAPLSKMADEIATAQDHAASCQDFCSRVYHRDKLSEAYEVILYLVQSTCPDARLLQESCLGGLGFIPQFSEDTLVSQVERFKAESH